MNSENHQLILQRRHQFCKSKSLTNQRTQFSPAHRFRPLKYLRADPKSSFAPSISVRPARLHFPREIAPPIRCRIHTHTHTLRRARRISDLHRGGCSFISCRVPDRNTCVNNRRVRLPLLPDSLSRADVSHPLRNRDNRRDAGTDRESGVARIWYANFRGMLHIEEVNFTVFLNK